MLTSFITLGYLLVKGVKYEVTATLLYQLGPELATPPTMTRDQLMITRRVEDVNDEIEILASPDLVRSVVENLGDEFFKVPPPTTNFGKFKAGLKDAVRVVTGQVEEAMIQLGLRRRLSFLEKIEVQIYESLDVELVQDSDVISVTLETSDPEGGEVMLQKLLEAYQERHLAVHQELAVKAFLDKQTSMLRGRLTASREELLEFQTANDLWSSLDQQKHLLENHKTFTMQVATTSSQIANLESVVQKLAMSIAELPAVIELSKGEQTNPVRISLADRLATVTMTSAVVSATYNPNSVERIAQDRQAKNLQSALGAEPPLIPNTRTEGVNQIRQDLVKEHALKNAELDGLKDQLRMEQTQLGEMTGALRKLGEAIAKYQLLDRDHQLLEQKYVLYVENHEKADIASVMNLARISNMELISPPIASKHPTQPRLKIIAAAGIVSGLILAFMMGVVFDLRAAAKRMKETVPQ